MFRRSIPLIVIAALVISIVVLGSALNARPTVAQDSPATIRGLIQSYMDQGQAFTINTRATNLSIDGTTNSITQLGDDYLCVSGTLSVMGNPMQTICSTFDSLIIIVQ
jgi:hypothetical protein